MDGSVGSVGQGSDQAHQAPSAASAEPSGQGIKPESAAPVVVTVDGAASGAPAPQGPPQVPISMGVTAAIEAGKSEGRRGKRQQCGSACAVCAKSKAACDPERPCKRCVRQNKVEQCLASSAGAGAGGQVAPPVGAGAPVGEGVKPDGAQAGGIPSQEGGEKKKRKQIGKGKACLMCTKAKAACDDMRPCSRCQRLGHPCEAKPATMTSPRQIVPTHPSTAVVSSVPGQGPVSVVAVPLQQLQGQPGQPPHMIMNPQMLHNYIIQGMQQQPQQPQPVQQPQSQPKPAGTQPSQAAPAEGQAEAAGEGAGAAAAPARKDEAGHEAATPALGSSQASGGVVRSAAERIFENTAAERIFDNTAAYALVNGGKPKTSQDPPPQQPPAAQPST